MRFFLRWWLGESTLPTTRFVIGATWMLQAITLLVAVGLALHITHDVRKTPPPALLSVDAPLYGLSDAKRRLVFSAIASDEPRARAESAEKFAGEPWSIEDDRAAHERDRAREVAPNQAISISQAYLILDEGIREHWPAPKAPLDGSVVPLKPRFR